MLYSNVKFIRDLLSSSEHDEFGSGHVLWPENEDEDPCNNLDRVKIENMVSNN